MLFKRQFDNFDRRQGPFKAESAPFSDRCRADSECLLSIQCLPMPEPIVGVPDWTLHPPTESLGESVTVTVQPIDGNADQHLLIEMNGGLRDEARG